MVDILICIRDARRINNNIIILYDYNSIIRRAAFMILCIKLNKMLQY